MGPLDQTAARQPRCRDPRVHASKLCAMTALRRAVPVLWRGCAVWWLVVARAFGGARDLALAGRAAVQRGGARHGRCGVASARSLTPETPLTRTGAQRERASTGPGARVVRRGAQGIVCRADCRAVGRRALSCLVLFRTGPGAPHHVVSRSWRVKCGLRVSNQQHHRVTPGSDFPVGTDDEFAFCVVDAAMLGPSRRGEGRGPLVSVTKNTVSDTLGSQNFSVLTAW